MATFQDLYATHLDYELGTNDSNVLFTTARRKASVNQGLREFADLTACWQRESTIAVISGQAGYSLVSTVNVPALDFARVTADGPAFRLTDASSNVTVLAGDDFPRRQEPWLNAAEPGWQGTGSSGVTWPMYWWLDNIDGDLQLQLYPAPTLSTGSTAVLRLPYVARPSSLVNDTAVPFTDTGGLVRTDLYPYHQAIVHYAAARLELLRKDTDAHDRQMQKFLGYVQRFIQNTRKPAGDTIRPGRFYFTRARSRHDEGTGPRAPWWR